MGLGDDLSAIDLPKGDGMIPILDIAVAACIATLVTMAAASWFDHLQ